MGVGSAPGVLPQTSMLETMASAIRSGVRHQTMYKMMQGTVAASQANMSAVDIFRDYILPNLSQIPSIHQYIANRIGAGYGAGTATTVSISQNR